MVCLRVLNVNIDRSTADFLSVFQLWSTFEIKCVLCLCDKVMVVVELQRWFL